MIVSLIGVDGSGKSTLAKNLVESLESSGEKTKFFYLNDYLLLKYVVKLFHKLHSYTKNGKKTKPSTSENPFLGTQNKSFIVQFWVLIAALDNLANYFKMQLYSLFGYVVITDRYFYDKLIGFEYHKYSNKLFSYIYLKLTPKPDLVVSLDLEETLSTKRETNGTHPIEFYKELRNKHKTLAKYLSINQLNVENLSKEGLTQKVMQRIKKTQNSNSFSTNYWIIILLGFASLISLGWVGGDYVVGGGDNFRSINFYNYLSTLVSSWQGLENTGRLAFSLELHLPYSLFFYPASLLGLSGVLQTKIWLYLSMFLPAYFTYLFLKAFLSNKKIADVFLLIGALLYVINPLLLFNPIGLNVTKYPIYLALPLLAYCLVRLMRSTRTSKKMYYMFLFALGSSLSGGSFRNIAEIAPAAIFLLGLIVFELTKEGLKRNIKYLSFSLVIAFFLNLWWLSSSFLNKFLVATDFAKSVENFSPNTFVIDTFRLLGSWAFLAGHRGVPYYTFGRFYYSPGGFLLSYLFVIAVFIGVYQLLSNKNKVVSKNFKLKYFYIVFLAIIGILLSKGSALPLGNWYVWAYNNIPLFKIFREPFSKFSLLTLFSYTVLLAGSLYLLNLSISKYTKRATSLLAFLYVSLIIVYSFPLLTGDIVQSFTNGVIKQGRVIVPEYWLELHNYSQSLNTYDRTLTLPKTGYYGTSYIWPSGYSGRPSDLFWDGNTVFYKKIPPLTQGDEVIHSLFDTIDVYLESPNEESLIKFTNLSRLLNISYLLQQNDADWWNLNAKPKEHWSYDSMQLFLESTHPYFVKKKTFGKFTNDYLNTIPFIAGGENIFRTIDDPNTKDYLDQMVGLSALELYKINSEYYLPKIYIADTYISIQEYEQFLDKPEYLSSKPVVYESLLPTYNINSVTYSKLANTVYEVNLNEPPSASTTLVFNETFDSDWALASTCGKLLCTNFMPNESINVNLYANGWVLDKETPEKFYIVHKSRMRFMPSLVISITTFIFVVTGLLFTRRKLS